MLGRPSRRNRKRLEDHGRRAWATVLERSERGMSVTVGSPTLVQNTEVVLKTHLRVEPDGEPSFEWQGKLRYGQLSVPSPGERLAVVFDPEDHEDLMLDPSPPATTFAAGGLAGDLDLGSLVQTVQQAKQQAGGDSHQMAELLRHQLAPDTTIVEAGQGLPGAAPAPAVDPVAQLEKLADLRDRDVLTPEEFEAQKHRLLGDSPA